MIRSFIHFKFITTAMLCSLSLTIVFISCSKNNSNPAPSAADKTTLESAVPSFSPNNLIGYWKFNGNPNDASGNGNNGHLARGHPYFGAGLPTLTTDRFGRANMAYHFDHGGNIEVPYTTKLNPHQMTISLWVREDTAGRTINTDSYYMVALDRWNGYKFQTQSTFLPFYTVKAVEAPGDTVYYDRDDAGVAVIPYKWYHLAVTFKPGEEDFYVNGSLVKEWTNTPGTPVTLSTPIDFVIGQDLPTSVYSTDVNSIYYVNYGGFWTGDMDDVMFFNTALSSQQIKSIYDHQKTT